MRETGAACPDIEILKNMSVLFGCSISDIINSNTQVLKSQCANFSDQVYPQKAVLAPTGTAISLMSQHAGGMVSALCQDVVATHKDGILTCTLINRSYSQQKCFTLNNSRALLSAEVYTSEDVVPTSTFRKESLAVSVEDACARVVLPAHSIAVLKMKID